MCILRKDLGVEMKMLTFIVLIIVIFFLSTFLSDYIPISFNLFSKRIKRKSKMNPTLILEREMKKIPFMCNSKFYSPDFFIGLKELQENWKVIREEALKVYKNSPILKIGREKKEWIQTITQKGIDRYGYEEGWIYNWNVDNNEYNKKLLNYRLMVKDQPLIANAKQCPKTMKILSNIEGINIAGFSWMTPNSEIRMHRDMTGLKYGSLAYHLGLIVPKGDAILTIEGETEKEEEGKAIIFDSTFLHSEVNNCLLDRIILYVDFRLDI